MPTIQLHDHNRKTACLALDEIEFEAVGNENDPTARLMASIDLGGVFCHLEAIAVTTEGEQRTVDPYFEDVLVGAYLSASPDRPFRTADINGRQYVYVLTSGT